MDIWNFTQGKIYSNVFFAKRNSSRKTTWMNISKFTLEKSLSSVTIVKRTLRRNPIWEDILRFILEILINFENKVKYILWNTKLESIVLIVLLTVTETKYLNFRGNFSAHWNQNKLWQKIPKNGKTGKRPLWKHVSSLRGRIVSFESFILTSFWRNRHL